LVKNNDLCESFTNLSERNGIYGLEKCQAVVLSNGKTHFFMKQRYGHPRWCYQCNRPSDPAGTALTWACRDNGWYNSGSVSNYLSGRCDHFQTYTVNPNPNPSPYTTTLTDPHLALSRPAATGPSVFGLTSAPAVPNDPTLVKNNDSCEWFTNLSERKGIYGLENCQTAALNNGKTHFFMKWRYGYPRYCYQCNRPSDPAGTALTWTCRDGATRCYNDSNGNPTRCYTLERGEACELYQTYTVNPNPNPSPYTTTLTDPHTWDGVKGRD